MASWEVLDVFSRPLKIDCPSGIQQMACSTRDTGDPPLYRAGVCIQRLQDSVDSTPWSEQVAARRLEADTNRVDFLACHCDVGSFGGCVWQVAGRRRAEQGDGAFGHSPRAWVRLRLRRGN